MAPELQTHLALNGGDTTTMLNNAESLRSVAKIAAVAPEHTLQASFDPVTPIQKALGFFHSTFTHPPGTTSDISNIQAQLQAKGYGTNLQLNQPWNGQWNQAMLQHTADKLTALGTGNVSAGKVIGQIFNEAMPATFLSQLGHWMAAAPAEAFRYLADAATNPAGIFGYGVTGPATKGLGEASAQIQTGVAQGAANLAKTVPALNAVTSNFQPITAQELEKQHGVRGIEDALNALQFISTVHTASDLLLGTKGIVNALTPKLASDASIGEKLAAIAKATIKDPKTMLGKSLPEEYGNAPRNTIVKSLYQGGAAEGQGAGILNALNKLSPFQKRVLPAFDSYISKDGSVYFNFKQRVGQWARNPIRQFGAQAQSAGMQFGLKTLGISEAEDALTNKDPKPPVDLAHVKPYGGIFGNGINMLGMLAGNPMAGVSGSKNAAAVIKGATDAVDSALGATHVDYAIKSGLGMSFDELKSELGPVNANHWVNGMINQYAAHHWAEQVLQGEGITDIAAYTKRARTLIEEAQQSPQILHGARESLLADKNELATYFKKEMFSYANRRVERNVDGPFELGAKGKERFIQGIKALYAPFPKISEVMREENRHQFYAGNFEGATEDLRSAEIAKHLGTNTPKFDAVNPASNPLYHLNGKVSEFSPEPENIVENTPFGKGIKATDNKGWAGRTSKNVYALQHMTADERPARFYDMTQRGQTTGITNAFRELIGGNQGRTVTQNANIAEMSIGEGQQKTQEYNELRKMLKNTFDYSPQDIVAQYRKALVAAQKLTKNQIDVRINDLTQSFLSTNGYTGFKYVNSRGNVIHVVNPEKAIAVRANMPAELSKDNFLSKNLVNNHVGRGQLSWVRPDTLMSNELRDKVDEMFSELRKNGHAEDVAAARSTLQLEGISGEEAKQLPSLTSMQSAKDDVIWHKAEKIAWQLGMDPAQISRYDAIELLSSLYRASRDLPTEAKLLPTADAKLLKLVDEIKAESGLRPALGTGIGHTYEHPLVDPIVVENHTKWVRRAATKAGLGTDPIKDKNTASIRMGIMANEIDKGALTGRYAHAVNPEGKLSYNDTGSRILSILAQGAKDMGLSSGNIVDKVFRATGAATKRIVTLGMDTPAMDKIFNATHDIAEMSAKEIRDAKAEFMKTQNLLGDAERGIRDLAPKQMVKILTQPVNKDNRFGYDAPRYDKKTAQLIVRDILRAQAKTPASYLGIGKVDDVLRASGAVASHAAASFLGKVPLLKGTNPDQWAVWNPISALPARLINLRDRFRFDLNPLFGLRRMVKTNLKAAMEGVPVASSPYLSLIRLGKLDEAKAIVARTMPNEFKAINQFGELDKTLAQNDIFNLYNPLHNMMWQAVHLSEQGLTDEQIAAKLVRINTYGDRTAFEKSIATVFYPFSFNKTLYRNIGGYLLDNPGKAMLANEGIRLWDHYQHGNNDLGKWMDQHFPLIQQLKQLNAFDHGIGLGEFGGINAPYISDIPKFNAWMNMFGPQAVTPQNAGDMATLMKQLIPAWSELNGLLWGRNQQTGASQFGLGTLPETLRAGGYELMNLGQHFADYVSGQKRDIADFKETMDIAGQQSAGFDFVTSAKSILAQHVLAGNSWDSIPGAPAVLAGDAAAGIAPQKINTSSIEQYAHILYPAYVPGASVSAGLAKAQQAKDIINSMRNDQTFGPAYRSFYDQAEYVVGVLRKSKDYATIADLSNQIRQKAVILAEYDPRFLNFYKKFYASSLGPIEMVK